MVCVAPWYGLSFSMSPAKRKPSELSLKPGRQTGDPLVCLLGDVVALWLGTEKDSPKGLDHPLPGTCMMYHTVLYFLCRRCRYSTAL